MLNEIVGTMSFLQPEANDDGIDRLNYYYTSTFLIVSSLLISLKMFGGRPLECWLPAEYTSTWESYSEMYCWAQNTYFASFDDDIPQDVEERKNMQVSYYQWSPFFLVLLAFLMYLPCLLWRFFNAKSGIRLIDLIEIASDKMNVQQAVRSQNVRGLANHLASMFRHQYNLLRPSCTHLYICVCAWCSFVNLQMIYYAVARGYTPGIYLSWPEAQLQVNGFPCNSFKSFPTIALAQRFIDVNRVRPTVDIVQPLNNNFVSAGFINPDILTRPGYDVCVPPVTTVPLSLHCSSVVSSPTYTMSSPVSRYSGGSPHCPGNISTPISGVHVPPLSYCTPSFRRRKRRRASAFATPLQGLTSTYTSTVSGPSVNGIQLPAPIVPSDEPLPKRTCLEGSRGVGGVATIGKVSVSNLPRRFPSVADFE